MAVICIVGVAALPTKSDIVPEAAGDFELAQNVYTPQQKASAIKRCVQTREAALPAVNDPYSKGVENANLDYKHAQAATRVHQQVSPEEVKRDCQAAYGKYNTEQLAMPNDLLAVANTNPVNSVPPSASLPTNYVKNANSGSGSPLTAPGSPAAGPMHPLGSDPEPQPSGNYPQPVETHANPENVGIAECIKSRMAEMPIENRRFQEATEDKKLMIKQAEENEVVHGKMEKAEILRACNVDYGQYINAPP
jgi:hypothetical protein